VRIAYFIQTGALVLKSACGRRVLGAFDIQKTYIYMSELAVYVYARMKQRCVRVCIRAQTASRPRVARLKEYRAHIKGIGHISRV